MLVAGEGVDVFVTVQNPFAFDLEVSDLSLMYVDALELASDSA